MVCAGSTQNGEIICSGIPLKKHDSKLGKRIDIDVWNLKKTCFDFPHCGARDQTQDSC